MSTNVHNEDTGRSAVAPAILLWVLVACGLLYGVVQTATKIPPCSAADPRPERGSRQGDRAADHDVAREPAQVTVA